MKILFNGNRVSVWDDRKVLEMDSGNGCRLCGTLNDNKLYT